MNESERMAKSMAAMTAANRDVLLSSRGWHMYLIEHATGFQFGLPINPNFDGPIQDIFKVPLVIRPAFNQLDDQIDLAGNVPEQVADRLTAWAAQMLAAADEVRKVPSEPYEHKAKAYVVRDTSNGEVIGSRLFLHEAAKLGLAFEDIIHEASDTRPEDVTLWPEVQERAQTMLQESRRYMKPNRQAARAN